MIWLIAFLTKNAAAIAIINAVVLEKEIKNGSK